MGGLGSLRGRIREDDTFAGFIPKSADMPRLAVELAAVFALLRLALLSVAP